MGFPSSGPVRWLLRPAAALYAGVIRARNAYYDRVPSAVRHAGVPVISVGNLAVGGTGKTPFVIEIVRRLREFGRRPAILTRGYKAPAGGSADEVLEFGLALPGVPVIVNHDRVAGAAQARAQHGADCLVLDDGFQHRRLARDLDLVLVSALGYRPGDEFILPSGRLREPLDSLRRADLLIITRVNQAPSECVAAVVASLRRHAGHVPIAQAAVEVDALLGADAVRVTAGALVGQRVVAVCGLGDPRTFLASVRDLVQTSFRTCVRDDHHHYGPADARSLVELAHQEDAALVVTTRKDWVKLAPLWPATGPPLVRLDVRVVMREAADTIDAALRRALETPR